MTTPREQAVAELRRSIDVLPERTRKAMLIGLGNNTVITGAFAGAGGACPMLAAHREGGRTSSCSFPEAWDRFTGVAGRQIVRAATEYEVLTLRREIEASLEPKETMFAEAIAEHQATVEARRRRARFGASPVDFTRAIGEHMSTARDRRGREADATGLDWLFEQTLVLPEGFGSGVGGSDPEQAPEHEYDFGAAEAELQR